MPTKIEGRSSRHDLIDDIVEAPASSPFVSNSVSSFSMDTSKALANRNYSSYTSIPTLFNTKNKLDKPSNLTSGTNSLTSELRDRLHLSLPRSTSSSTMMSNDERRKELDLVLKHLYDGKLLTAINDDRPSSEISEPSTPMLTKAPITTTTSIGKFDDDPRMNLGNLELLSVDEDATSLQRELQEKELDIIHLHKEIQELQLENKLLRAKVPTTYGNGHTSNGSEVEALRREKEVLQNELRTQQELVNKLQLQQHQNGTVARANRADEFSLHQREAFERKLKNYEKQLRALNNENDKLKQLCQESDRAVSKIKRENEELQQKVAETKKRNDELVYQELNGLRNDLKLLKQRNDELFEENRHLQHEQQRQQQNLAWRATLQQAYGNEIQSGSTTVAQPMGQVSSSSHIDQLPTSSPLKASMLDPRRDRGKVNRSESPNLSEGSDSTNYLTTVSVERYNNRPTSSMNRLSGIEPTNSQRVGRYTPLINQEDYHRNIYTTPVSKSVDPQVNYRPSKTKRSVEWDEENLQQNEGSHHREMTNYDPPPRVQRHHSSDGTLDYKTSQTSQSSMLNQLPPAGPSHSSSASHIYQQTYGMSRSVTVPESQHQSRRSNSYNVSNRHTNQDDEIYHENDRPSLRHRRPSAEAASPRRPYAPTSITDIRTNDLIKFSRPGGKISKGIVKYIGPLPGKNDQYLGLELEDEESKHDGVYQGQRLFQCKPNKGVFVGFSKVIMAWSGK